MVWAAFAVYVGANWAFAAGESFIGAFLPEIATPRNVGRVSAFGWSLGYVGTLLVLPASLLITGVGAFSNGDYRRVFVFAAAWFLVMAIPTFAVVRERPAEVAATEGRRPGAHLVAGLLRLRDTFRDAARHRRFLRFLAVFTVYSCGTQAVIYFATIVAKDRFGFDDVKRVLFMLQLGATAGLGALIAGAFQDRAGHRATLAATLALWVVATAGALATPMEKQFEWAFWLVGNMVGLALGAIGTASRAFAGSLTPLGKTAEFFGLWSMAYRAAGVAGPWAFGIVSRGAGINAGLLLVIGFFALGLVGMLTAREDRPARA
jgi:UMF1 family MFS transporter